MKRRDNMSSSKQQFEVLEDAMSISVEKYSGKFMRNFLKYQAFKSFVYGTLSAGLDMEKTFEINDCLF